LPGLSELFRRYKREEKVKERKIEEAKSTFGKTFLKAMPIRDLSDLDTVKNEVRSGNILILRITPLANKSIEDVKKAVNELCEFVESLGGDIARLGEERVVVCPPNVKIWREKPQVASKPISTVA